MKRTIRLTEDLKSEIPLDLSFSEIENLEAVCLQTTEPKVGRLKKKPPLVKNRYRTRSLWLSYNNISWLFGLRTAVSRTLLYPEHLAWIDLSFNKIKHTGREIFTDFPNLKILYLHNNEISEFLSVFLLRRLQSLRVLTLKHNPIEQMSEYRVTVLAMIPQLVRLDFSTILPSEKSMTNAVRSDIARLLPTYAMLETTIMY